MQHYVGHLRVQGSWSSDPPTSSVCCAILTCFFMDMCLLQYWSPREEHAVAVYESTMYLVGGLVSIHNSLCGDYACGDTDASSIGQYMSDIWRSTDGEVWVRVTSEPGWSPRAGHQLLFFDVRQQNKNIAFAVDLLRLVIDHVDCGAWIVSGINVALRRTQRSHSQFRDHVLQRHMDCNQRCVDVDEAHSQQ